MARGNFKLEDQRQAVTQAPQARPVNPHGMASTGQALQSFGAQLMHEGGNRAAQFVAAEKTSYFNRSSAVLKQKTAEFETQATLRGERNLQKATNDFVDKMTQDLLADAPSEEAASQFIDNVALPYKSERLASIHKVEAQQRAAIYHGDNQQAINISNQTIEAHPELYEQSIKDIKAIGKSSEGLIGITAAKKMTDEGLEAAQILRIQGIGRDNPLAALISMHAQEHTDRIPAKTFHALIKENTNRLNTLTSQETISDFKKLPYKTNEDIDRGLALIESRKGLMDQPTYFGVVSKYYDWTKDHIIQNTYNDSFQAAEKANTPLELLGPSDRIQKYAQGKVDALRAERANSGQPPPTFREETDLRKTTNSNQPEWNTEYSARLNKSEPEDGYAAAEVWRDAKQTNPAFVEKVPQADQDLARYALENYRARPEKGKAKAMEDARDYQKPENKEQAKNDDARLKRNPRYKPEKLGKLLATEAFVTKWGFPDPNEVPGTAKEEFKLRLEFYNRETHNTAMAEKLALDDYRARYRKSGVLENKLIANAPSQDRSYLDKGHVLPQVTADFILRKAREQGDTLSPNSPQIPPNTPLSGLYARDHLKGKQLGLMREGVEYAFDIESDEKTQDATPGTRTWPIMLVNKKTGERSKYLDKKTGEQVRLVLPSEAQAASDPLLKELPRNEQESLDYNTRTFLEKRLHNAGKMVEALDSKMGRASVKALKGAARYGDYVKRKTGSTKFAAIAAAGGAAEGFLTSLYEEQTADD